MKACAHDILHSSVALGLVGAALSVGAVVGNAVTTWLAPRLPRRATYALGFFVAGAPRFVALALLASLPPVLAVMFVSGLGAGGINPGRHPLRQPAGALLVSSAGVRIALMSAAIIYGLATLPPFLFPIWRQMDAPSPTRPTPLNTDTQFGSDIARTGRSQGEPRLDGRCRDRQAHGSPKVSAPPSSRTSA